jgi:anaerobic dimethyl sulfoxide reductase subunit B (iron-sulfur subunit)
VKQIGFYLDQSRCSGCYACVVACKDWNNLPAGPLAWRWIISLEDGKYPYPRVTNLSLSCLHCAKPLCLEACPVGAITKRQEDGIVLVDRERCLGKDNCAMLCKDACPYDIPQFGIEENAKMQKCDFCFERFLRGEKTICVDACPLRALDCGPLDELKAKYGDIKEAEGFIYSTKVAPSIILKPQTNKLSPS